MRAIERSNDRFSVTSGASFDVAAGAAREVTVRFSATSAGAQTGTLTITSNDAARPSLTAALSGAGSGGAAPAVDVSPTTLDFGTVNTGQTKDLFYTVRNNGATTLTVTSVTSSNPRFTHVQQSVPFNIGPGSFGFATLRFSPTAAGAQTGTVTITSNDPATAAIPLSVTGTGAGAAQSAIEITPPTLDLGTVTTGQTKDLFFTIRNNGATTLTVTAVTSSNARFTHVQQSVPFNIGPGSFGFATLRFSPTAAGAQSGTITITSNVAATASIPLSVTGTGSGGGPAQSPAIEVTPASLDFGSVVSGQSKDLVLTFRNTGNATLTVSSVTSSNARFAAVSLATPFNIGAGSSQTANIRFSPNATGSQTGTLTIVSNVSSRPSVTLSMRGTGTDGGSPATPLRLSSAAGCPNGRTSNQLPALAIDGNTNTYTWTTESFNSAAPSYLGVSLAGSTAANRIRIYKDADSGGAGDVSKNLTIEYTTSDPSIALASRVWTPVSGLANGFNGAELMTATSVNSNGTVTADRHISAASGRASLTFNRVNITGIRIGFQNVSGTSIVINHYRVYELQIYNDTQ